MIITGVVSGLIAFFAFEKKVIFHPVFAYGNVTCLDQITTVRDALLPGIPYMLKLFLRHQYLMEHRVYHGHHGLTQVHVNSTLLLEMGLVTEDDAAMKMTQIILILVMKNK